MSRLARAATLAQLVALVAVATAAGAPKAAQMHTLLQPNAEWAVLPRTPSATASICDPSGCKGFTSPLYDRDKAQGRDERLTLPRNGRV